MTKAWIPPMDYAERPVAVLGGGVIGRRVALTWATGGYHVQIQEPNSEQHAGCISFATGGATSSKVEVFSTIGDAVRNAWLIIECVPEMLDLKASVFSQLELEAPADAILATNSSSFLSSEIIHGVSGHEARARILNTHYTKPPVSMIVEMMTDGYTHAAIFPFLLERQREVGLQPFVVRKESIGLVFNRLWAAVKRETLSILAEGVSTPKEIDALFHELTKSGKGPCQLMDDVGLETVALVEDRYVNERKLDSTPVDFLRNEYLSRGKLGTKSALGGLYPPVPTMLVLDLGIVETGVFGPTGKILQRALDGSISRTLIQHQLLPDGIDIDVSGRRLFWSSMGKPGELDGTVQSANLDGTDIRTIVAPGTINTPKQLRVSETGHVYFSDREGMRILRCNLDGSDLETLVQAGTDASDATSWCVGVQVSHKTGILYWTQRGPSRSGKGRIFCAGIAKRPVEITCLVDHLPEPIDLELDSTGSTLFWTDRGEIPNGNSLNKISLDPATGLLQTGGARPRVLMRGLHDPIGLKLDEANGHIYTTGLGGSVYRCNLDGSDRQTVLSEAGRTFTGLTLLFEPGCNES